MRRTPGVAANSADAMGKDRAAEGKIAPYGIYFDTGKSEIKHHSKPQFDEMGKLLDASKSLRMFVVGHTEIQGQVESNLELSQKCAAAIQAALAKDYEIDAKRLSARGVGSCSPVASNAHQASRARSRRMESVEQ